MRNISANMMRAIFAQQTDEVPLMCTTLSHSSFAAPYYLVTDLKPLVRAVATFEPFAFQLNLPSEQDDSPPQVQMVIDNVDNAILVAIRTLPAGERVSCLIEVVLASSPNTVEAGPIDFKFLSADYDASTITGTLGFDDDVLNAVFPVGTYTPVNSPGMFA